MKHAPAALRLTTLVGVLLTGSLAQAVPESGEAVVTVNRGVKDVQKSNYGRNAFRIINRGAKPIASVEIDVTGALYPDTVFDPEGLAGDTVSKKLTIDTPGGTGVLPADKNTYRGPGGDAGYEAIVLRFSPDIDGGFEPGESVGFSVDMDPNSIAGMKKGPLDAGSSPKWDVGGVSGAELIGSRVTVTFADGTGDVGWLHGDGSNAGSHALVRQGDYPSLVELSVQASDGQAPARVTVNGIAGQTVRVVLTKGFIQPVENRFSDEAAARLDRQLARLRDADFPANNAVEFQTVDVELTGEVQDITDRFTFDGVAAYDFPGEDALPMAFVAAYIDPTDDGLPTGLVTPPVYLVNAGR